MYCRNFNSKRLPCPSRRRNGGIPSLRSKTPDLSNAVSIATSSSAVMLPFSEQQQKVGICFPLKVQTGPQGCLLSRPPVLPRKFFLSPIHSAAALKPKTQLSQRCFAAKMIAHMTGSPVAAVKPKTVKCESFVPAFTCGRPAAPHKNFSPPTFPSFVVDVLDPTSSTNKSLSGRCIMYSVGSPKASCRCSTISPSLLNNNFRFTLDAMPLFAICS